MNKTKSNTESYIDSIIWRAPKKNHDKLVELCKQYESMFKNNGVLRHEIFQLTSSEDISEFTNLAKVISANLQHEEVWIEMFHYKDKNHCYEIRAKLTNDKNCQDGYQQFIDLITPGSKVINGEFIRHNDIGFQ